MKSNFNDNLFKKQIKDGSCALIGGIRKEDETGYTKTSQTHDLGNGKDTRTQVYNEEGHIISSCVTWN